MGTLKGYQKILIIFGSLSLVVYFGLGWVVSNQPNYTQMYNDTSRKFANSHDFQLIGDLYEPGFHRDPRHLCRKNLTLLAIVTSSVDHEAERNTVRRTWAESVRKYPNMQVAFLVGHPEKEKVYPSLAREDGYYHDIIQTRMMDTYDNLGLKSIALLEWVEYSCPNVDFVLKVDDDVFVNVPRLLELLPYYNAPNEETGVIVGRLAHGWKPIRDKKSKYYVSTEVYQNETLPDFVTGPAYLLNRAAVAQLYQEAMAGAPYLKLEDVFLTGVLAERANVLRVNATEVFRNNGMKYRKRESPICMWKSLVSMHHVTRSRMLYMWKRLLKENYQCQKPANPVNALKTAV